MLIFEAPADVSYSQISLFRNEEHLFNGWTDEHVAQGFAYRKGHVSFGVPDHDGQVKIEFRIEPSYELKPQVLRAIQVPFSVDANHVVIATIFQEWKLNIEDNAIYSLYFEILEEDQEDFAYTLKFTLVPDDEPDFRVLRKSDEMTSDVVITTTATEEKF